MIRRVLAAIRNLWEGSRWVTIECGCRFTVTGPREIRTCLTHEWGQDVLTLQLQQLEASR